MNNLEPHIMLGNNLQVDYAILPGDPARINRILPFLEQAEELAFNREYRSVVGTYRGTKILLISTGMGGPSMAVAIEELKNIGLKNLIRIGSCGALQENISLGTLIISEGAVRDEGTSSAYVPSHYPAVPSQKLLVKAIELSHELDFPFEVGLIRSHDSFYRDDEEIVCQTWSRYGVLGADFETSTLYTVGRLRGLDTLSILNNVVEYGRDASSSIQDYLDGDQLSNEGEQHEIKLALEICHALEVDQNGD